MRCRSEILFSLLVIAVMYFTETPAYAQKFTCASNNNQYQTCQIPGRGNPQSVRMVRQLSQTPCVQGRSWGTRGNQVWVDKGCRREFAIGGPGYGGPGYGGRPPYGGDYHGGPPRGGPPAYYAGSFSGGRSNCTSGRGAGRSIARVAAHLNMRIRSSISRLRTKSNVGRLDTDYGLRWL